MIVFHRAAVIHAVGALVAQAVASPHRDAALVAYSFLIDNLKPRPPIRKKEIYSDGAAWIGERS